MNLLLKCLNTYRGLPHGVYILASVRFINSFGSFVNPMVVLILTQNFGLSKAHIGMILSITIILQGPSVIIGGKLADTIGCKRTIVILQSIGAFFYIICGFMGLSLNIIYLFILASNFYAAASPAFDAYIADLTIEEQREKGFSLSYIGFNLGYAIGPVIAGFLYKSHLSMIFIGNGITTFLSIFIIAIAIKDKIHKEEVNKKIEDKHDKENQREESVINVLLKRPMLIYFTVVMFIYNFVYSQWGFAIPIHLGEQYADKGAQYYGIAAGLNGIIVVLFTSIVLMLFQRFKTINSIAIGGIFYGIAFGLFAFLSVLPLFFVSVIVMTIAEIVITINSRVYIAKNVPTSHRGRVSAVLPLVSGGGYAIGPMVMGMMLTLLGLKLSWLVIAVMAFTGAGLMLWISKKEN